MMMRHELGDPGLQLAADGQEWNVWITAHGLIMVFFVVMPGLIGGFGNWFLPLMIGAPDMAFPRLNNIFILADCSSFLASYCFCPYWFQAQETGWTIYPPLSSVMGHPGMSCLILPFSRFT